MVVPLVVLAVLSAVGGFINTPWRLGLESFLEPSFEAVTQAHPSSDLTAWVLVFGSVTIAIIGIAWGWARYRRDELPAETGGYWDAALAGYHVDDAYGRLIVAPGLAVASWSARIFDLRVVDGLVNGLGIAVRSFATSLRPVQSGYVRSYGLGIAFGALGLIVYLLIAGGAF